MSPTLITVGIPTLNNEGTIGRAIASVRNQTRYDWHLRISDDGSVDGTWSVARAAAATDNRISVSRQRERRMFMNFGDLLANAQTPFFVWLSADDYWAPDFLAACLAALEARRDAVSALPRCAFIGEEHRPGPLTGPLEGPARDRMAQYLEHPGGTRMYGLARTSVLQAAFPRRNMNAYDWHLMLGLLRAGPQVEVPRLLLF
jgi:glycosyltransferase involved in cell wall biosynthesis